MLVSLPIFLSPSAMFTFLDNFLVMIFKKRRYRSPLAVSITLTYSCNLTCHGCNTHSLEQNKGAMDFDNLKNVLWQLKRDGTILVILTGGEPMRFPFIVELLSLLRELKFKVQMNTNGLLLDSVLRNSENLNINKLIIGITDPKQKTKRYLDSLFRTCQNQMAKGNIKKISLRFVTSPETVEYDLELLRESKFESFVFQPLEIGNQDQLHYVENGSTFSTHEINKYFRFLMLNFFLFERKMWHLLSFIAFLNQDQIKKKYRCYSGYFNIKIDTNGMVFNCSHLIDPIANFIGSKDILASLNSDQDKLFKQNGCLKNCFCYTSDNWFNPYFNLPYLFSFLLYPFLNRTKKMEKSL